MKTFFGMTAAVLLVVTMLFVSLPGMAVAGEIRNRVHHTTSCEIACKHGQKIKSCHEFDTFEEYEGIWPLGEWVQKQTETTITYENQGNCDCDPLVSCGQCQHCENLQCVPDPCKPSPSSPDDCPCPPAK